MVDRRYCADELHGWATAVLTRCGVAAQDATQAASILVRTSLRGIDTHGIARLPGYAQKLRQREVTPDAAPVFQWASGALSVDGKRGLGQVVVPLAVREAIKADTAVVACSIANVGHLGALGVLLLDLCERGYMALLCQNTPPIMAMPGATTAAIGNNPIAFAAPVAGQAPLILDMASSVVARGHVALAQREGRPLPDGWAMGPDGRPTSDPAQALRGAMLPIAGHKGIGLAMVVECLAGALTGVTLARPTDERAGSVSGVSAFLLVIDPARFVSRMAFDASMRAWIKQYCDASGDAARYPGQRQHECERERGRHGIPVTPAVVAELCAVGEASGVPFDETPA